jgi:hypothetical protein
VLPIEVPPLRERREDILPMAERFMRAAAERLHVPARELTPEERDVLVAYDFPGNVRELQNIIERAMVLEPTGRSALAREVARVTPKAAESAKPPAPDARTVLAEDGFRSLERQNVVNALEQCGWRVAGPGGAAELLGVRPSTLAYRLKRTLREISRRSGTIIRVCGNSRVSAERRRLLGARVSRACAVRSHAGTAFAHRRRADVRTAASFLSGGIHAEGPSCRASER